jgi:hypothetical protein
VKSGEKVVKKIEKKDRRRTEKKWGADDPARRLWGWIVGE